MFVAPLLLSVLLCVHIPGLSGSPLPKNSLAVDINNELALNLLQMLSAEDNTFFSPLSLSATLLTLANGAKGDTEREIRHALNLDDNDKVSEINGQMKDLLDGLAAKNSEELTVKLLARMLVADSSGQLKDAFVKTVKDNYRTEVMAVDFQKNNKAVTKDLNQWVSTETKNRIPRLFKDSLDPQTNLVLANVVHFSGKWKHPFPKNNTEKREFHNFVSYHMPGLPSQIHFMTTENKFRSKTVPELRSQLLELPYSQDMSMVIVLPDTQSDLQFLNENMTLSQMNSAINDLQQTEPQVMRVTLPRFKLETDYDLKEPLEDFDIKTLFTPAADLSGALKNSGRVSTAVHKASIEVTEEGTEASAGTGVAITALSLPPALVIDRPFVFLIRDQTTGLMAFIGRVQTLVDEELLGLGFI